MLLRCIQRPVQEEMTPQGRKGPFNKRDTHLFTVALLEETSVCFSLALPPE